MAVVTPLYGHIDENTAYVVDDYPYGFKLRCKIRYWLEHNKTHGYRFVSQTTNPKKGNIWNKPKKSTYVEIAACMFLDENNYVQWSGVGIHANLERLKHFAETFPGNDLKVVNSLIKLHESRNVEQ